jgi:hypothetical protein
MFLTAAIFGCILVIVLDSGVKAAVEKGEVEEEFGDDDVAVLPPMGPGVHPRRRAEALVQTPEYDEMYKGSVRYLQQAELGTLPRDFEQLRKSQQQGR